MRGVGFGVGVGTDKIYNNRISHDINKSLTMMNGLATSTINPYSNLNNAANAIGIGK